MAISSTGLTVRGVLGSGAFVGFRTNAQLRQFPLQFDLASDVFLDTDEVGALFGVVPYRGDRQFVPESAAILR